MKRITLVLALLLSSCAGIQTLSRDYKEPTEGPMAKVRFSTNGELRLIPNRSCRDWTAPNSGVVVSNKSYLTGKPALIGQKIGMLGETPAGISSAEVRVVANQPITVDFEGRIEDGDWIYTCRGTVAFVPKANEEYQMTVELDAEARKCKYPVLSLTNPRTAVQLRFVEAC